MSSEDKNKQQSIGFVSVVSGVICVIPETCLDGSDILEYSRFSQKSHVDMIGCQVPVSSKKSDLAVQNGDFSVTINNDRRIILSYFLETNHSEHLYIVDPFIFFDDERSMFSGRIMAIVKGRYANFLLRNCGVLEGDTIVINESDFSDFDDYVKTFNKKNKASVTVDYKPYGIPYIARAKTKSLEKDGTIQTSFGDMFVLKTMNMDGDFKVHTRGDDLIINKFNERE